MASLPDATSLGEGRVGDARRLAEVDRIPDADEDPGPGGLVTKQTKGRAASPASGCCAVPEAAS